MKALVILAFQIKKKAERIYVKRLGFEPPPVTEKRRYQGEQSDILVKPIQVSDFQLAQLSNQTQVAFVAILQVSVVVIKIVELPALLDTVKLDGLTSKVELPLISSCVSNIFPASCA